MRILETDHVNREMKNLVEPTTLLVYDAGVINDCISAATDIFEDNNCNNLLTIAESTATSGPYENDLSTSSAHSIFQSIVYNDVITQPFDRNKVLLAACYGVVDNFDLGQESYSSQKKKGFPLPRKYSKIN